RLAPPPPPVDVELADADEYAEEVVAPPAPPPPVELVWIFDDLVLESPRSREEENQASQQRFGFSVYHRLF
ncbi:MAG: hypothetical protein FWB78_09955, partial [Treponema sp.]|nr:hypothetical protein [Treponema sp.]